LERAVEVVVNQGLPGLTKLGSKLLREVTETEKLAELGCQEVSRSMRVCRWHTWLPSDFRESPLLQVSGLDVAMASGAEMNRLAVAGSSGVPVGRTSPTAAPHRTCVAVFFS
jgi:hypothetical protein